MFNNYGTLKWTTKGLIDELVFLDFTILVTKSQQLRSTSHIKTIHLHLYILPHLAHLSDVTKGAIYKLMKSYWETKTNL